MVGAVRAANVKIAKGEIPAEKVFETEELVAFNDINPMAPVHQLVIPRQHIASADDLTEADAELLAYLDALREYRHNGIGSALLRYAIGEVHRHGKPRVGLAVDSDSLTGATRLYEKAGMRVVRQYDQYQLILREGVDLSTQTLD